MEARSPECSVQPVTRITARVEATVSIMALQLTVAPAADTDSTAVAPWLVKPPLKPADCVWRPARSVEEQLAELTRGEKTTKDPPRPSGSRTPQDS